MPEVIEMHRMIVRNKETGESIGSRPININKIPSTYQLRTKMLKDLAHLIACESKIKGEFNELRYVLISHSNRAVSEGDL